MADLQHRFDLHAFFCQWFPGDLQRQHLYQAAGDLVNRLIDGGQRWLGVLETLDAIKPGNSQVLPYDPTLLAGSVQHTHGSHIVHASNGSWRVRQRE